MEFDVNELKEKIDAYFEGEISKKELGDWANRAYYDILKGGYVEEKKIVIYPFLKKLSLFHVEENDKNDIFPCSEISVRKIQDILSGNINYDFNVEISIPKQVYNMFNERPYFDKKRRSAFVKLCDIIEHYVSQGCVISREDVDYIEKIMDWDFQRGTIQGLLEKDIILFMKALFRSESVDENRKVDYKIFPQKSNGNNLVVERLSRYLDCYAGNRNFYIFVSFINGVARFFLVL